MTKMRTKKRIVMKKINWQNYLEEILIAMVKKMMRRRKI